jgi:hypothetical protein
MNLDLGTAYILNATILISFSLIHIFSRQLSEQFPYFKMHSFALYFWTITIVFILVEPFNAMLSRLVVLFTGIVSFWFFRKAIVQSVGKSPKQSWWFLLVSTLQIAVYLSSLFLLRNYTIQAISSSMYFFIAIMGAVIEAGWGRKDFGNEKEKELRPFISQFFFLFIFYALLWLFRAIFQIFSAGLGSLYDPTWVNIITMLMIPSVQILLMILFIFLAYLEYMLKKRAAQAAILLRENDIFLSEFIRYQNRSSLQLCEKMYQDLESAGSVESDDFSKQLHILSQMTIYRNVIFNEESGSQRALPLNEFALILNTMFQTAGRKQNIEINDDSSILIKQKRALFLAIDQLSQFLSLFTSQELMLSLDFQEKGQLNLEYRGIYSPRGASQLIIGTTAEFNSFPVNSPEELEKISDILSTLDLININEITLSQEESGISLQVYTEAFRKSEESS